MRGRMGGRRVDDSRPGIDSLSDDPRVVVEIVVSRPVEETYLFGFSVPQFTPFLVRIERERVLYLSTRSSEILSIVVDWPVVVTRRTADLRAR